MKRLSREQILMLHSQLIEQTGGTFGVRDFNLLESAIETPFQSFAGEELYPTIQAKGTRLGYGLIKNHCMLDDNKRIGTHMMLVFLFEGETLDEKVCKNEPFSNYYLENELAQKGIEITSNLSKENKMYPLGYNLWPSFGFGSFCAFDMNISNSCPLVLWWGNLLNEDNALDNWYPLLPRRSNAESDENDMLDWENDDLEKDKDQYNMCPDCFCYFGHEQDGGNGFCIDCAWKH